MPSQSNDMGRRGLFVTFEGGEGSGKTSQIERLGDRLCAQGIESLTTREPGGTPAAEAIRSILLGSGESPSGLSEAFLMEAARADLVFRVIRPALEAGVVVLCDRYADSTLAYQGAGRGIEASVLEQLNRAATQGLDPDLTILFDLDPETGIRRREAMSGTANRLDREPLEFHRRVRQRYLELARRDPARWVVLDAAQDPSELEPRVWEVVSGALSRAGR